MRLHAVLRSLVLVSSLSVACAAGSEATEDGGVDAGATPVVVTRADAARGVDAPSFIALPDGSAQTTSDSWATGSPPADSAVAEGGSATTGSGGGSSSQSAATSASSSSASSSSASTTASSSASTSSMSTSSSSSSSNPTDTQCDGESSEASCLTCCTNAYSSGSNTYNTRIFSLDTNDCACAGPCATACGNDDYCITDDDISSDACLACVRTAVAAGGGCAFACTGSCASFATCFDGCP